MALIPRKQYIDWLERYRDKQLIKVVTGMRRVGKSTIFDLYIEKLLADGIPKESVIKINFEDMSNASLLDKDELFRFLSSKIRPGEKLYIFLDEVQHVDGFERVADSLFIRPEVDLYLTGSNAKFLSSEIATLLTGRYVEINVLPLSLAEYAEWHGGTDRRAMFMDYITYGALPGALMFEKGSAEQREYIESVYRTILQKDVLKRNSSASREVVEGILNFLLYNVGCLTSVKRIADTLNSSGIKVSYNTVSSYFETLRDCFFVFKADRYDVVGKGYLQLINKYYVTDFGFKYYILNNRTLELSQILENLVFLELKRRRCKVATGKVEDKEVDFVAQDGKGNMFYVQVAVTVADEDKLAQELRPFALIHDNHPKYIITLDDIFVRDHDGILTVNAIDFLMGGEL